jgi:hypothetical protein
VGQTLVRYRRLVIVVAVAVAIIALAIAVDKIRFPHSRWVGFDFFESASIGFAYFVLFAGAVAQAWSEMFEREVALLPRWAWFGVVLLFPLGTLVYFAVGRGVPRSDVRETPWYRSFPALMTALVAMTFTYLIVPPLVGTSGATTLSSPSISGQRGAPSAFPALHESRG